jgi:hypothetical protein
MMKTFSKMAEEWLREYMQPQEVQQAQEELAGDGANPPLDELRQDFVQWMSERCIQRKGRDDWGAVGCLWVDFCEWVVGRDGVPCPRRTFEQLLHDADFLFPENMVYGLILREDFDGSQNYPQAPGRRIYAKSQR